MKNKLPNFQISPEVRSALETGKAVVALESTVITHGLPYPENQALAQDMETVVRDGNAIPATVAILEGKVKIGLSSEDLEKLAQYDQDVRKISVRDYGPAIAQKASGGTTVAGTLLAAQASGIRVFATGGIGGVHRNAPFDISTDLPQLGKNPVVVVCAGAKSILDLPATLEYLETMAVPVIGYQTDEFPAFYSRQSGLPVSASAANAEEAAQIAKTHWSIGQKSAVLVVAPPPEHTALKRAEIDSIIEQALDDAEKQKIRGQALTPFLLSKVSELSEGSSLTANLALLKNNARIAADIAQFMYQPKGQKFI